MSYASFGAAAGESIYETRFRGPYQYKAIKESQLPIVMAHLAQYKVSTEGQWNFRIPGFEKLHAISVRPEAEGVLSLEWLANAERTGDAVLMTTEGSYENGEPLTFLRIPRTKLPELVAATQTGKGAIFSEPSGGWILPGSEVEAQAASTSQYVLYGVLGVAVAAITWEAVK